MPTSHCDYKTSSWKMRNSGVRGFTTVFEPAGSYVGSHRVLMRPLRWICLCEATNFGTKFWFERLLVVMRGGDSDALDHSSNHCCYRHVRSSSRSNRCLEYAGQVF